MTDSIQSGNMYNKLIHKPTLPLLADLRVSTERILVVISTQMIEQHTSQSLLWWAFTEKTINCILIHYVCLNAHFHWLWRRKFVALKSYSIYVMKATTSHVRRSNVTKTFWKDVLAEWIRIVINIICVLMNCRYHFTVANIQFTAPLTCRGKSKFATVKWYNLSLQIIQSQTCCPLNLNLPQGLG